MNEGDRLVIGEGVRIGGGHRNVGKSRGLKKIMSDTKKSENFEQKSWNYLKFLWAEKMSWTGFLWVQDCSKWCDDSEKLMLSQNNKVQILKKSLEEEVSKMSRVMNDEERYVMFQVKEITL